MLENAKKFGTFGGVFTPTLLTILGVIMYLRLGWVVGNAGLVGALLIILISFGITITTAMSMSSITTNIQLGAGGAYAIIARSLGLEVGGSLGIPRYISQGLAVTMYIFGFREGWLSIPLFSEHDPFLIDLITFGVLYAISYKSADLAIRTQYIIMGVIFVSLISIVFAAYNSMTTPTEEVLKWGSFKGAPETGFKGTNFWMVFAVFFPAATGIMAGANMSGELKDPRKSIPNGTLWAIAVSLVIYVLLAFWIARSATEEQLVSDYNIMIKKARWSALVTAGVLGATFSSALGSMVGSSRILYAMGEHRVLPKGKWLAATNSTGQPRNAMLVTGILVFSTMLLRELNAVAPLVTMFFLITYAMLNVVVIIEQNLGLISFRPTFVVHPLIPWIGLVGSVFTMFIINPLVSLISIALVFAVYWVLSRSKLETPFEDVRSGLFVSFAEWAAKHTASLVPAQQRAWKPNMLVPVTDPASVKGIFSLLENIAYPKGSIKLLGIGKESGEDRLSISLLSYSKSFQERDVFSSWTVIKTDNFADGVNYGNQALMGAFFKPNIIFINHTDPSHEIEDIVEISKEAKRLKVGLLIYHQHPIAGLGKQQVINIWIRDRSPDWELESDIGNLHLCILLAYKLKRNWHARIRLITVVADESARKQADDFMNKLVNLARLPKVEVRVETGDFKRLLSSRSVSADLNIFGLTNEPSAELMEEMVTLSESSCFFVRDSGLESALA